MKKVRKVIVGTLTFLFGIIAIISGAMLDSKSIIPSIIFLVSMTWITLFVYVNNNNIGD